MASQITGYIGQINPGNGINYSIGSTVYGECNTAATTAAKTVDMTGFILIKGATIYVKFTNANTASSPTLNVQGTGAKPIISNDTSTQYWPAGTLLELTYNDENWITNNLITYNIAASDLSSSSTISTPLVSYNNNKLEYNEYVQYLRKPTIIDSSTSPAVQHYATGLKILGSLTGNNDNLNVSGQRGVFSINQPGPQIRFGYINDVESNQGALIYTNNNISSNGKNENNFGGSSFHFVADGEKPTKLVAGGYTSIDGIKSSVTLLNLQSIEGTVTSTTGNTIISTLTTDRREEAFIRYYLPAVTTTYSGGIAATSSMQNARFYFAQRSPKSLTNTSTTASNEMPWEFYRLPITTSDLQSSQTYEILTSKIPANEEVLGGIRIGYTQTDQNYPIELNNNDQAYVNVPWTDNNTATAADNILEGSNNGTEITYSPYSTKQNKLSFYTGSTNPNGTNRLNLNGYLYATKLYSGGLEVLTSHQSLDNYKTKQTVIVSNTGTAESDTATRFIYSFSQDANGVVSVKTRSLPTYNNYSLPLASSAALGGIKIGYTQTGQNYPVKLDNEKAYVEIPWTDTDEKVKQTSNSTTANYKVLFTTSASPNGTAAETYYNTNLQYNPGTNILSTGNLSLSGNLSVTGATTLSDNVTIGGSLTTNSLTVNGNSQFNNSVNFNSLPTVGNQTLLSALGLNSALRFIGITSTTMTDGTTAATVKINGTNVSPKQGDVIIDSGSHREYVWTGVDSTSGTWEMLGFDRSETYNMGTTANNANIGIIKISQATDGSITATTGNLVQSISSGWTAATATGPVLSVTVNGVSTTATIPAASDTQSGVITTSSQTFKGIKTFYNETTTNDDGYTGILFTIKDSTIPSNKTQFGSSTIRVYSDHRQEGSAGTNFVLQSGGNTIIGSGEAGLTYYNKIAKTINNDSTQNNVIGKWNNTSENFYLLADTSLYLEANNNIPSGETNPINRAGIMITTDGNIIPVAQELNNPGVQSLGNTEAAWKNLYLTNSIVSTTKNLSITLNSNTTKIWIYDNTTTATYNGRNITPSLYVSGTGYFDGAVEASTNFINNVNTTGGGFYIKSQDIEYGRLYINTQGTTATTGIARLILGNATATGNIGNAQGSIYLYSSSGTYVNILNNNTTTSVQVKIPNYNGHMVLAHVGNTNNAIGSSTTPVYVEGSGKISAGSTYAGGTKVTLNGTDDRGATTASFYAPTSSGTSGTQALVSSGANTAPAWTNITPSISITDGDGNNAPKINVSVLGQTGTTAKSLNKASTTVYGVIKLSSDTNSDNENLAATPAAVKAAIQASAYAGSIQTTSAATYNTEPEVKSVKINGSTTSATTSTTNVQLVFDTSLKVLNFVFS